MKKKAFIRCISILVLLCLICVPVYGTDNWESDMDQSEAIPGDMNGNHIVDNKDVEYLLWHTLFPEDYPLPVSGDFDQNDSVDNKDVEYLLWHTLFPDDYPLELPHVHTFTDWTEFDNNLHSRMCSECQLIEKKSHKMQLTQLIPSTCAEIGFKTYNCSDCEYTVSSVIAKTDNHDFSDWSSIANDQHYRSCSVCAKEEKGKHAWDDGEMTTPVTCDTDGVLTYTCEVCKETKTSVILATNHSWERLSSANGIIKEICTVCNETRTYESNHSHNPEDLETALVSEVANKVNGLGNSALMKYRNMTDVNISYCSKCGYVDYNSAASIYTAAQETALMIDMMRGIRHDWIYEDLVGNGAATPEEAEEFINTYKHVSDKTAINHAIRRAQEISTDYSHNGAPARCAENISAGDQNWTEAYVGWKNSPEHYTNMIRWAYPYVGCSRYIVADAEFETITIYYVAIFRYY